VFTPKDGKIASRNSSEKVLNALAKVLPEIMGGSVSSAAFPCRTGQRRR
jgi:transketolase